MKRFLRAALIAAACWTPLAASAAEKIDPAIIAAASDNIVVTGPYAVEKQKNIVAAYMTIHSLKAGDALIGGASEKADQVVLAEIKRQGGREKALKIAEIPIPAGGKAVLDSRGLHVLLIGLDKSIKSGDVIPMTLQFRDAGKMEIQVSMALIAE